jgi:hypothetical protein
MCIGSNSILLGFLSIIGLIGSIAWQSQSFRTLLYSSYIWGTGIIPWILLQANTVNPLNTAKVCVASKVLGVGEAKVIGRVVPIL